MMKVDVRKRGYLDLTEVDEIIALIGEIDTDDDEIELNLQGCLVGYETSLLVELLAKKFSDNNRKKTLSVIIEYQFLSENALWEWLFKNSILWKEYDISQETTPLKLSISRAIEQRYNIKFNIGTI